MRLQDSLLQVLRPTRLNMHLQAILRMYSLLGITTALLGAGYFLLKKLNIKIEPEDQITLTITASGLLLFLFSRITLQLLKERREIAKNINSDLPSELQLLKEWSRFEEAGSRRLGESISGRPIPIRQIIKDLIHTGLISSEQAEQLEEALTARNSVAHGMAGEVAPSTFYRALRNLRLINAMIDLHPSSAEAPLPD